jgi:hypothetical protein
VIVCFFNIDQQNKHSPLESDGQQFTQYQQNKQSPLDSDGQHFTPISTKQTITSTKRWSTIHTNIIS